MRGRYRAPLSAALALLLWLPAGAQPASRTYVVTVDKMKFGPVPAELHRGDIVIWDNRDIFRHSATASDGSFDIDLPAGKKVRLVIRKRGLIRFLCKYHPGMRGVLRITDR
ncbi:MAG TPA: cupredoxin domain-containing protein [Qipengyuania sp.]|nr:cupredoxin domain-containing protein [Qipengyuania sp.]